MKPKFQIGQTFKTRGKGARNCVVTDILFTYNSAGELVRFRYVAEHEFFGQRISEEVPETTVAMGATS